MLAAKAAAPLAGACLQPPHPWSPDAGGGVFHSLFRGPSPVFFWLFSVRPSAFFLSVRLAGPFGFVPLCFVSSVRRVVGRGFFASLAGRFGGRASVVGWAFGSVGVRR